MKLIVLLFGILLSANDIASAHSILMFPNGLEVSEGVTEALEEIQRSRESRDYWDYYADCDRWKVDLTADFRSIANNELNADVFLPIESPQESSEVRGKISDNTALIGEANRNDGQDPNPVSAPRLPATDRAVSKDSWQSSYDAATLVLRCWAARFLPSQHLTHQHWAIDCWESVCENVRQLQFAAIECENYGFRAPRAASDSAVAERLGGNSMH